MFGGHSIGVSIPCSTVKPSNPDSACLDMQGWDLVFLFHVSPFAKFQTDSNEAIKPRDCLTR